MHSATRRVNTSICVQAVRESGIMAHQLITVIIVCYGLGASPNKNSVVVFKMLLICRPV